MGGMIVQYGVAIYTTAEMDKWLGDSVREMLVVGVKRRCERLLREFSS